MSVMVAEVAASAAQSVPKTGLGTVTVAYGTDHVTSGAQVYTATTCTATWGAGGEPNAGTSVGDFVVTQDGYWGVFVSGTATVVTVDYWRTTAGGRGTPTNGQSCRIYNGKCVLAGSRETYVHRLVVSHTTAGTFAITDPWGTVLYTHNVPVGTDTYVVEFCTGMGEPGLFFDKAIGFKASVVTVSAVVVFST